MYAMRTDERGLTLAGEGLRVSIGAAGPGRMRIWTTARDAFEEPPRWVLAEDAPTCAPTVVERVGGGYRVTGDGMYAEVVPEPLSIAFFRDGRPLLRTAPGPVFARDGARLTVRFAFPPGEAVYGLGQNTRHALNLRDVERRMWNQYDAGRYSGNAGIPFLLNSSGYGVLLNTSWAARIALGRAEPCEGNERVVKPAAPWPLAEPGPERDPEKWAAIVEGGDLDLFVLSGDDYGAIMRGYYEMTGHPPMPPKWALGLMQCKNRYKNQKQLLEVARGYRRRGLPLDVMIIDWNWFRYFGFFRWLPGDWPDPAGMFRELRSMGIRVLAAVHPYMHEQSPFFESFERAGALIEWSPQGAGYWPPFGIHHAMDFTHPEARRIFWETVKPLVEQGLAGFWTDMGELEVHPEDSTPMYLGTREQAHNLYTSCWTDAIYRGWRGVFDTRCFSLPRTSYAGTQRNGCAMWTGDVDSSFDVLRDQIMIIQQLSVSGQPFTCSDIGGFIAPPYYDPELYTRWYQWGVFCPMFRTHGTRPDNEPWSFGARNERILAEHMALRYRLMPYLYSAAFRTCDAGEPMVLPMAVAFPSDPAARDFDVQYLFGGALLVSPVVVRGAEEKETYLPEGAWYDFYTGELLEGGRTVMRAAPQSLIPVYAKAGSIIPMAEDAPSTDRIDASRLRLRVYPGADCRFQLYEDDGESYACERGERMLTDIRWDEAGRVLTIEAARGQYRGNPERRSYVVEYPGGIVSLPEGDLRVARQVVLPRGETAPAAQPSIDYAIEMNELAPQRVVKIYLNNPYGAPLPARVRLTQPVGYEGGQRDAACEAAPGQTVVRIPLTMRGAQSASATLGIEVELGDVRAAFTESLNSGWATWWRLALPYAFEDDSGLDAELLPERTKRLTGASDVSVCAYEDHQCFGYVNLQSAMMRALPFDQLQGLRGARRVGYAACVAHVPEDASGFLLLMGEDRLRVFVDGRERMRVEDRFESPQRTGVALSAGEHRILVKAAQDGRSEWNDRAWGFYFAIADEAGKPIDGITYRMED